MNPKSPDDGHITVNEGDRQAARQALARNWRTLETRNPKYAALLEALAQFHHRSGAESFELRYNLRPPKDRTEVWTSELMQGQITEAEFERRVKADAERPIDLDMLKTFCDAYEDNLSHYSGVLQRAVATQQQAGALAWRENEKAIDDHVAALRGKLPLWSENLEKVFDFLEGQRITSGASLLKLGKFEATSAHWLAQLVFTRVTQSWQKCKEVSERSQRDRRYLYAATAIGLFNELCVPDLPNPQSMCERLREEFILARAALDRIGRSAAGGPSAPLEPSAEAPNDDQLIDNESRELALVGEITALVAKAGHIYRTLDRDRGIDGEIEFKGSAGQATARKVYVQLKSGDSYLKKRVGDGVEIFTAKKQRHLEYWAAQAYPVMLVIRGSSGLVRWMDVRAYLKTNGQTKLQIVFRGERVTVDSIRKLAENSLSPTQL